MAQQIIKQPNGLYCIFSTIVGNVTYYDMTEDDIIRIWSEDAKADIEQKVKKIVGKLEKGENPYHQFTMSFNEMMKKIKQVHGKEEYLTLKSELSSHAKSN